jgi:hypothetical protein
VLEINVETYTVSNIFKTYTYTIPWWFPAIPLDFYMFGYGNLYITLHNHQRSNMLIFFGGDA